MSRAAPLARGHRKRARTQRQLIEAGLTVLAARGEAMTATDVVHEAGVSNGTFYNHFEDIEDLQDDMASHLAASLARAVSLEGIHDPAERFAVATARVLALTRANPSWGRAMLRLLARPGGGDDVLLHARQNVADGYATGRFAVDVTDAVMDQLAGLTVMTIHRIVNGLDATHTDADAIGRGLEALGVSAAEAQQLATDALAGEGDS